MQEKFFVSVNFMNGRIGELLLILLIILLLFGAGKLPKIMGDIGKSLKAFKDGTKSKDENQNDEKEDK